MIMTLHVYVPCTQQPSSVPSQEAVRESQQEGPQKARGPALARDTTVASRESVEHPGATAAVAAGVQPSGHSFRSSSPGESAKQVEVRGASFGLLRVPLGKFGDLNDWAESLGISARDTARGRESVEHPGARIYSSTSTTARAKRRLLLAACCASIFTCHHTAPRHDSILSHRIFLKQHTRAPCCRSWSAPRRPSRTAAPRTPGRR